LARLFKSSLLDRLLLPPVRVDDTTLHGGATIVTLPETRYAKSGDIRIAYQVIGNGPLDLVFVPGFISNLDALAKAQASAIS
jgi:hypothetical protein